MQCEHPRKAIAADPGNPGEDAVAHARDCTACGAFLNELLSLDRDIARAMNIEVPDLRLPELPPLAFGEDDGEDKKVVAMSGRRVDEPAPARAWKRSSVLFGIAAGVAMLALVTLLRPAAVDLSQPTIAEEVIAHMDHEQQSRQVTSVAVSEQKLDAVVEPRVSRLGGVGLISYAQSCVIGGNTVPHLVVQGERGPITLILLPDEKLDEPISLSGVHVHGLMLPVGDGSIAVIGEREDQLREVEETGRQTAASLKWRI